MRNLAGFLNMNVLRGLLYVLDQGFRIKDVLYTDGLRKYMNGRKNIIQRMHEKKERKNVY